MAQYIDKDRVVAEIEKLISNGKFQCQQSQEYNDQESYIAWSEHIATCEKILSFINTLEVKDVDLEKEIETHLKDCLDVKFPTTNIELIKKDVTYTAKKFFELGMSLNNPITAADRGTAEEIIINLKRVEQDYRIDLTREMEWVRNKVKKGE